MTTADVLPLAGHPAAPPKVWAVVTASADPFATTTDAPAAARVAKSLIFSGAGSVTVKNVDGSDVTFTLAAGWTYPFKVDGMFTHLTAATGSPAPTVYAGFW